MSKRKVNSAEGEVRKEPKRRSIRLSAKPVLAKVEPKPERTAGKNKSEDKKNSHKRKKAKGKQAEATNQEDNKDDLPAENGEPKNEEVPVSDSAGEKETKFEQHIIPCVLTIVPVISSLVQFRGIFISTIL